MDIIVSWATPVVVFVVGYVARVLHFRREVLFSDKVKAARQLWSRLAHIHATYSRLAARHLLLARSGRKSEMDETHTELQGHLEGLLNSTLADMGVLLHFPESVERAVMEFLGAVATAVVVRADRLDSDLEVHLDPERPATHGVDPNHLADQMTTIRRRLRRHLRRPF